MDDGVVVSKHVHLIDVLQLLHAELLDGGLELLVFLDSLVVDDLLDSPLSSLTSNLGVSESLLELSSGICYLLIHVCLYSYRLLYIY